MDSVKMASGSRGKKVEAARQCAKDRKEWTTLVHMWMIEFHRASVAYHLKRGGMLLHVVVGVNCKKGATAYIRAQVPRIWVKG